MQPVAFCDQGHDLCLEWGQHMAKTGTELLLIFCLGMLWRKFNFSLGIQSVFKQKNFNLVKSHYYQKERKQEDRDTDTVPDPRASFLNLDVPDPCNYVCPPI